MVLPGSKSMLYVDSDPRKKIEVDPDPDLDPERGLKWIRIRTWIRPNAVDPGGSGSETLTNSILLNLPMWDFSTVETVNFIHFTLKYANWRFILILNLPFILFTLMCQFCSYWNWPIWDFFRFKIAKFYFLHTEICQFMNLPIWPWPSCEKISVKQITLAV